MAAGLIGREGYYALSVTPSQILLQLTISNKCGQSFRWHQSKKQVIEVPTGSVSTTRLGSDLGFETEWSYCLHDRVVCLRQDIKRDQILFKPIFPNGRVADPSDLESTEAWVRDYLNLDVPLEQLYTIWSGRDPVFAELAGRFSGIRMLRQDPWECLISFICSSNNNIARIGQMVQKLCLHFSPCLLRMEQQSVDGDATEVAHYHPFPSAQSLAAEGVEAKLRELGFGYRAKYIAETARQICALVSSPSQALALEPRKKRPRMEPAHTDGNLEFPSVSEYLASLRMRKYLEARAELLQFPGIGPKVADCILLMSLDQPESIPVDRHVFAFAEKRYKIKSKNYEDIAGRLRDLWGEYAGWAHSILFTADLRSFQNHQALEIVKDEEVTLSSDCSVDSETNVKVETVVITSGGAQSASMQLNANEPISRRTALETSMRGTKYRRAQKVDKSK